MPHYDLALPRFETMQGLLPSDDALSIVVSGTEHKQQWLAAYTLLQGYERRILGGVAGRQTGGFDKDVKMYRSGQVTASFIQHRQLDRCTCGADLIATLVGFAVGVFDRPRAISSSPNAPAEIAVDICTCEQVGVGQYAGIGFPSSYGRLDENVSLDRYTLGESQDISFILNEMSADLFNAAGLMRNMLPRISWNDPH